MPHMRLQIQFGSDFEGYIAGFIPSPSKHTHHLPSSSIVEASGYTWSIMQIFFQEREYNSVGEEMSVGILATPLTLSAAALSWMPCFNFNRCSTMRIRQGELALLCVVLCMH